MCCGMPWELCDAGAMWFCCIFGWCLHERVLVVRLCQKVLFFCRGLYDGVLISCLALWSRIGLLLNYKLAKDRLTGLSLWQLSCDPDGRVAL